MAGDEAGVEEGLREEMSRKHSCRPNAASRMRARGPRAPAVGQSSSLLRPSTKSVSPVEFTLPSVNLRAARCRGAAINAPRCLCIRGGVVPRDLLNGEEPRLFARASYLLTYL